MVTSMNDIELWHGDCLELMKDIPDGTVDMILCDPPYGTLGKHPPSKWKNKENISKWDSATLDTGILFSCIKRVLRENGKALIFSQEPYTSELITKVKYPLSFCYNAIWLKNRAANILGCNTAMVNVYENISLFTKIRSENKYNNPICSFMNKSLDKSGKTVKEAVELVGSSATHYFTNGKQFRIPTKEKFDLLQKNGFFDFDFDYSILKKEYDEYNINNFKELNKKYPSTFNIGNLKCKSNVLAYNKDSLNFHPTQKPVALLEDLIKTFSNEEDVVLDFTMGSGSTGVACKNLNRKFIGIELDDTYFEIAKERIEKTKV